MTRRPAAALSGLVLAVFVAGLSSTIVANALPRIVAGLSGTSAGYTWIVTSSLLAATASGPVWGKLADRTRRKPLVQAAIGLLGLGMALAGLAPNVGVLIGLRVVEGIGAGGLVSLAQTVLATLVPPRERARHMAYFTAAGAVAAIGAPPLGGLLVATPVVGWRACFWAGVPAAVLALVLVQRTLHVPETVRRGRVDWYGALFIPGGIAVSLIWLSFAGVAYPWVSWRSAALLATSLALVALAVRVERRGRDPIVPPRLLRTRTMALSVLAWVAIGVPMIGAPVFLARYFQTARGYDPATSGALTVPMVLATVATTVLCGRLVRRTGRCRPPLVAGTAGVVAALALLGTIDSSTPLVLVGGYLVLLGSGIGASSQNLVVLAQNALHPRDLGAGTATLTFFHLLGGAAGLSVLGTVFAALTAGSTGAAAATAVVFA
ncbi:MAG TPA: MFS transporter, partial [Actinocatenispora sp.]